VSPEAPDTIQNDNPQTILWRDIKNNLQGPDGDSYCETALRDALLPAGVGGVPYFTGTVISSKPQDHPSEVVVALFDTTPEVTLKFSDRRGNEGDFSKSLPAGTRVAFAGAVRACAKGPFMLTFEVDLDAPGDDTFAVILGGPGTPDSMASISVTRPSGARCSFINMSLNSLPQHTFRVSAHGIVTDHSGVHLETLLSTAGWASFLGGSRYAVQADGVQATFTLSPVEIRSFDKREWLIADTSLGGKSDVSLIVVGADGALIQRIDGVKRILLYEQR